LLLRNTAQESLAPFSELISTLIVVFIYGI
jgi:hypothetical protein